jgi:hypothetical protein
MESLIAMQDKTDQSHKSIQNVPSEDTTEPMRVISRGKSRRTEMGQMVAQSLSNPMMLLAMIGVVVGLMPRSVTAQAPLAIPYEHTIYAGNGASYTATAVAGSTSTPVHGTVPGYENVPATSAPFNNPTGMATDSLGNLYITDTLGWVRKVDASGMVTTFAGGIAAAATGSTTCPGGTNIIGDGCPANEAYLGTARAIAIDPATGDMYIAENAGVRIRKVNHLTYQISTVVGMSTAAASTKATTTTANGDLATCSSAAGNTCSKTLGLMYNVRGMAVDRHGNLYIADDTTGGKGLSAVRLANFSTGQLTTVVNTSFTQGKVGTCTTTTGGTAGAAILGGPSDITFDGQGNLYIADATCNLIYLVAENPQTGMVDSGSVITVLVGTGGSGTASASGFVLASSAQLTPGALRADLMGNLFFTESSGTRVWFYDAATKYVHTILGAASTAGNCYGQAGAGTAPNYNGCDGPDVIAGKGSTGVVLDAWGNLYTSDNTAFTVHKLTLGMNAPFTPTTPLNNATGMLHFGTNDSLASVSTTLAPDFTVTPQTCVTNGDNTQDCPIVITNSMTSSNPQYESFTATSKAELTSMFYLTNQLAPVSPYPVCQPATATSQTVLVNGATAVTLSSTPGGGCQGIETIVSGPHKYSYTVTARPSHGTLSGTAPALTYTPNAGSTGSDSFQYTVTDNSAFAGNSVSYDNSTLSIVLEKPAPQTGTTATVTLQNYAPPVATPDNAKVNYETPTAITLTATASISNTLTYSIVAGPSHGSLGAVSGNTVTYTPNVGFSGSDSFTFKANDGISDSNISTVSLAVTPATVVPVNQNVTAEYQTAVPITLTATGAAPIAFVVATQPNHGTLTGTAPNLTYTPAQGYSGSDLFTFTATNPGGNAVGTVTITVSAPPPAPVANNQAVTVTSNTPLAVTLTSTMGGSSTTYAIATGPAHGTLTGTAPNMTYVSTAGYIGADSFTFTASNLGGSSTGTVNVTVVPLAPVAANQTATVAFNTAAAVTLAATGTGQLTYAVVGQPAHGMVTLTGAVATYTPATAFIGTDSFTFTASNAGGASNVAKVSLTVLPAPPVASNQSVSVAFNTATAVTLTATGTGPLTYAVGLQPAHGTLTGTGAALTYTPTQNYAGTDSFTFTATNAGGTSNVATVTLTVAGGFTWAPASGGSMSATVQTGQTATYNLMISGYTGATGPLAITVTGAPATATVSPNPITLNGTTAIPVTISLPTGTGKVAVSGFAALYSGRGWPVVILLNALGLILILPLVRKRKLVLRLVCALAALALMTGATGCEQIPMSRFATPAGTYTLNVTATAGGVSSSQALTLTVTN